VGGIGTWLALVLKTAFALIGMGEYIHLFFPETPDWAIEGIAVAFALLFGLVNWYGAKWSGTFQIVLVVGLLLLIVGFLAHGIPRIDVAQLTGLFGRDAESLIATAGLVYISYVGVTKVASISEEVKNPERNLPLGIFLSLATALVAYVLCTIVMVGVVPMDTLAGNLTPMAEAAHAIAGRWGVMLITIAALIAFSSVANAGILSSSRYPLAMGRDHLLPGIFRTLSPRGTPTVSLAATVGVVVLLLLVLDPLRIAKLASAFQLLIFALLCLAVIIMRESGIESYDPGYRSPLYPWMQIVGIAIPFVVIEAMGWLPILFSGGLVGVGVGWYFYYVRKRVGRFGAMYHVFERLGRQRFGELDIELRAILKEKGLRKQDPFEEIIARASVIDLDRPREFDAVARDASNRLASRLECDVEILVRGFQEGTRTGATPVTRGVALPHMRLPGIRAPELVLVRCREGLEIPIGDVFGESHPRQGTLAVFFLVSADEDPGQHLRLLAKLASAVDDPGFMPRWMEAADEHALKELFMEPERHTVLSVRRGAPTEAFIDREVQDVDLPEDSLIAVVRRPRATIIPGGTTVLEEGDRITIIGTAKAIARVTEAYGAGERGAGSEI
jgi:amino acid transporter/mannitol/fructose-specific phosphotransferase system IIA component (Ntr-type)